MTLRDIRTMDDNEVLFLMSNKLPLKLQVKPYYQDMIYNNFSNKTPYLPNYQAIDDDLEYYELEEGEE
jgi:hypothetical protein